MRRSSRLLLAQASRDDSRFLLAFQSLHPNQNACECALEVGPSPQDLVQQRGPKKWWRPQPRQQPSWLHAFQVATITSVTLSEILRGRGTCLDKPQCTKFVLSLPYYEGQSSFIRLLNAATFGSAGQGSSVPGETVDPGLDVT